MMTKENKKQNQHKTIIDPSKVNEGKMLSIAEENRQKHFISKAKARMEECGYASPSRELTEEEQQAIRDRHQSVIKAQDERFADIRREDELEALSSGYAGQSLRAIEELKEYCKRPHRKSCEIYRNHNGELIIKRYPKRK